MSWKIGDGWPYKKAHWYMIVSVDINTDKFIEWAKSTDLKQGIIQFGNTMETHHGKMFHRQLRPRNEKEEQRKKPEDKGYPFPRNEGHIMDSRFDKIYNALYPKFKERTLSGARQKSSMEFKTFIHILIEQHENYLERAENYANKKTGWWEKSGNAKTEVKNRIDEALDQKIKDKIYDDLEDNHNIYPKLSKIFPYGKIERKNYRVVEDFGPKKAAKYFKEINGNTTIRKVRVRDIHVKFKGYRELFKDTGTATHINPFIKEALETEQTSLSDSNMMGRYLTNVERRFMATKDDDMVQFIRGEYEKYVDSRKTTIFTLEDGLSLEEFEEQAQLQINSKEIKEAFNAFRDKQSTIRSKSKGSIANIIRQFFEEFRNNMHVKTHYITEAITDYFKKEGWDEKEIIEYYIKLDDSIIPVNWSEPNKDTTGKFTYYQLKTNDDDYRELVNTVKEGTNRKLRWAFLKFKKEIGHKEPDLPQRFTGTSKKEQQLGETFSDKLDQYVNLVITSYFLYNKKLVSITHGEIKATRKAGYTIAQAGMEELIKVLEKIELNLLPTRTILNELTTIDNFNERYTDREQELKNNPKLLNAQIHKLSDVLQEAFNDIIIIITKIVRDKLEKIINNQEKYNEGIFRILLAKEFIEEMET